MNFNWTENANGVHFRQLVWSEQIRPVSSEDGSIGYNSCLSYIPIKHAVMERGNTEEGLQELLSTIIIIILSIQ